MENSDKKRRSSPAHGTGVEGAPRTGAGRTKSSGQRLSGKPDYVRPSGLPQRHAAPKTPPAASARTSVKAPTSKRNPDRPSATPPRTAKDSAGSSAPKTATPAVPAAPARNTASVSTPPSSSANSSASSSSAPAASSSAPQSANPPAQGSQAVSGWRAWIGNFLNTLVLLGSILIIVGLSIEVFHDSDQLYVKLYTRLQLWVCVIFLVDFFFRLFVSRRKWRFLLANFAFFLVSIPYLDIFGRFGIELTGEVYYLIRLLPLVRGGYGLAIMVGWITRNRLTSLMVSYVLIIAALVYFVSLVFFSLEHGVNPMVTTYQSALMWALMNVTTVGSDIYATTLTGQIMAVVLASAGMMMFPIFTVYITDHFRTHHTQKRHGDWL